MKIKLMLRGTAAIFAIVIGGVGAAQAQDAAVAAVGDMSDAGNDDIVVTGRLGNTSQRKVEASYSITTITDNDLRERAIGNLAEAMQQIPGVWADASAGVTANNIRVRGIPRGGYESLAVYEDGLPIQHDPGINWINVDQFLRIDETYASIEAVRGGPSSIFAANAPGGLVNFIPRKGTAELSGLVKLTTSDYGQIRGDVWIGGPIADDWRFSIGGYYNKDDGIRDPGPTANEGGQGRILISKSFARGNVSFGVKYMEDNNFFFDAIPLVRSGDDLRPLAPFNGHTDTLTGPEDGLVKIKIPAGIRAAEFNLFNQSSDLQFTAKGDVEFDGGTTLSGGFRYRDSHTDRNARGLNELRTQGSYLTTAPASTALAAFASRGATALRYVYVTDGTPYAANANGNGLVGVNTFQSIQNPIKEMIALVELGHVFDTGIGRHDVKLGFYGTSANWSHDRNDGVGLTEVAPQARLLDVVAVNAAGQVVGRVTDGGIARYESRYAHSFGGYEDAAVHISDEWQISEKLRVDAGFRYEKIWIHGYSEGVRTPAYNLGDSDTLADNNVLYGSGVFNRFDPAFDDKAYTVGVNWQFMPEMGVFARYTNTYRLPMIGQYRDNVLPTGIRSQSIEQAEGGIKFQQPWGSLYATAFFNSFKDVQFTNTYIGPDLTIVQEINYGDVRTLGLELESTIKPVEWFEIAATATYQDPKFKNYTYNTIVAGKPVQTSFDDNRPSSMPKVMFSIRPRLSVFGDRVRVLGEWRYEGDKYNDDANLVKLPAFSVFNASAEFDVTPQLTVQVKGTNLGNTLGLGQGGGQQAVPGQADGPVILARPIFGRAVQGSVLFRF